MWISKNSKRITSMLLPQFTAYGQSGETLDRMDSLGFEIEVVLLELI